MALHHPSAVPPANPTRPGATPQSRAERELSREEAVSPEAIAPPAEPKSPIANNDPTRNVSRPARVSNLVLTVLAAAALVVLAIATIAVIAQRPS
jgi:hypothetical protein